MEIRREKGADGPIVKGFAGTGFRVGEGVFPRGVTLAPTQAFEWDAPATIDDLTAADVEGLLALDPPPEFLLLGTGAGLVQPPRAFVRAVEAR
ncbi:MAG TPA: MTH938/NDUFAF3 family protein, partial [Vicinamibacterales bacterium]